MGAFLTNVLNSITGVIKSVRPPFPDIPALLLLCDIKQRPGLSAISISSSIIARLPEIGIPNGVNPDGSDNIIVKFIMLIVDEIVKEIKTNGISIGVIGPLSMKLVGNVNSAAGTVEVTNPVAIKVKGISG